MSVFKKERIILYPGKGQIPEFQKGSKVTFHFKTIQRKNVDEIVIDDSRSAKKPMELIIGKQFKLEIWEFLIKSMRIGEVSRFSVSKDVLHSYPFIAKQYRKFANIASHHQESPSTCCGLAINQTTGYNDLDELIRQPTDLEFIIELLDVQSPDSYEREIWQMEEDEKLDSVSRLRSEGNKLYAQGFYSQASTNYAKALTLLEQLILKEKPGEKEWCALDRLKIPLLSNYSQCKLIEGDYYDVIKQCDEVIIRDKENVKCYYRRARAHTELGNWNEAKADLEMVRRLDPTLIKLIDKQLVELSIKRKKQDEKERENLCGKLFS